MTKRIKLTPVERDEADYERLALAYWIIAKSALRKRREAEAKAKTARDEREAQS